MASTTTAAPTAPGSGRLRQISLTQRVLARPAAGALIIVIFVWVVFLVLSLARGNTAFLSLAGTLNYLDVAAQIGVIATSVALLMIAGEFDLSIGSILVLSSVVAAQVMIVFSGTPEQIAQYQFPNQHVGIPVGLAAGIGAAAAGISGHIGDGSAHAASVLSASASPTSAALSPSRNIRDQISRFISTSSRSV